MIIPDCKRYAALAMLIDPEHVDGCSRKHASLLESHIRVHETLGVSVHRYMRSSITYYIQIKYIITYYIPIKCFNG